MQNILGRIAAALVILCPVIAFSLPESAIQASSIKSGHTQQVKQNISIRVRTLYVLRIKYVYLWPKKKSIILYGVWYTLNNDLTDIIQFKIYIFTRKNCFSVYIIVIIIMSIQYYTLRVVS